MAKARKLPSGNWRVLLFVGYDAKGKRKYESFTAPTAAEANLAANQRKYELERGAAKDHASTDLTVGEAIDRYIDDRDGILSPKTVREYRNIRKYRFPDIMNTRLNKLTNSAVQRAINAQAKESSPKTVHNAYTLFKSAISYAAPDLKFDVNLPPLEPQEMTIPTEEQLIKLFEVTRGKKLEAPVLLAATTGLRRGEIAAIDLKKDIDYQKCEVKVHKAIAQNSVNEWVTKSTKSTSGYRTVRIPPWVAERLQELKDTYEMPKAYYISNAFEDLCKRLGFEFRFHDLRHYYASSLIAVGTPIKYAMKRMGHSTPDMLNKVYAHIIDSKDAEINAASDEWFGKLKTPEK